MHILIVSDLHHRRDWYRWVASQKVDLTVIAGDLMDGFDSKGGAAQMLYIDDWPFAPEIMMPMESRSGIPMPSNACHWPHKSRLRGSSGMSRSLR